MAADRRVSRDRGLVAGIFRLLVVLLCGLSSTPAAANQAWDQFKARFILDDGRVIDPENGAVSHSEGQGLGLLMAAINQDRPAFDRLWHWTRSTLQRSDVALFSWKYQAGATSGVADPNNAADGDILIAWALLRAGQSWNDPGYLAASKAIRQAISERLVRESGGRLLLLPGLDGFVHQDGGVVVNLSYWVFPAFQAFARFDGPAAPWSRLISEGEKLILQARFGHYALNPDWLLIDGQGGLAPAPDQPPRFGYDAVRIPLYLAWAGEDVGRLANTTTAFWSGLSAQGLALPAWVDLQTGAMSNYAAPMGYRFVHLLALGTGRAVIENAALSDQDSYYSAFLSLMAQRAAIEGQNP